MRVDDFDADTIALVRGLVASGVQYVVLEDDDDAVTIVPGPSQRNLERLVRRLRSRHARLAGAGPRLHLDDLVDGGPSRWPLLVDGVTVDVMIVGVADGRWAAYYHEAHPVVLEPGLRVDVVPDAPILRVRRGDVRAAMPELALTQRQRDRLRSRKAGRARRRGSRRSPA